MSCGCNCGMSTMRVECDGMCVDGLSAYELWAQNQPPDADTSREAFFAALRGLGITSITVEVKDV